MKSSIALTAALCAALWVAGSLEAEEIKCQKLGTAIRWEPSMASARFRAHKEGKLVLALHVSGEFNDPALT